MTLHILSIIHAARYQRILPDRSSLSCHYQAKRRLQVRRRANPPPTDDLHMQMPTIETRPRRLPRWDQPSRLVPSSTLLMIPQRWGTRCFPPGSRPGWDEQVHAKRPEPLNPWTTRSRSPSSLQTAYEGRVVGDEEPSAPDEHGFVLGTSKSHVHSLGCGWWVSIDPVC